MICLSSSLSVALPYRSGAATNRLNAVADVIGSTQAVGVLNDDVHRHQGANATQEEAYHMPQQDSGAILLEIHTIPAAIGGQTVAQTIHPNDGIDAASYDRQQDVHPQAICLLSITGAHGIHIAGQAVNEVPAVDTTSHKGQEYVQEMLRSVFKRMMPKPGCRGGTWPGC